MAGGCHDGPAGRRQPPPQKFSQAGHGGWPAFFELSGLVREDRVFGNIGKSRVLLLALSALALGGMSTVAHAQSSLSLPAQVGQKLFFDTNLSSSKQMACATCHNPSNHYAQSNALPVQYGGPSLSTPGFRAVPTLTYKAYTPAYSDDAVNPDGVSANAPGGGFTWSGIANTMAQQVVQPLLNSFEMDNASAAAVVAVVQNASYAALFQQAFGAAVLDDTDTAFLDVGLALQAFQMEDPSFQLFNSKFDYYAQNKLANGQVVNLTAAELRGFNVYGNPAGGNCFACHYDGPVTGGGQYLFTDFTYQALGVPRNPGIPADATRAGLPVTYYDLGLCAAQNPATPHSLPADAQYCGMFKVPTLRNVATRQVFFHNGALKNLTDVINWYNTRDTNPSAWYPAVNGVVQKYNDLPTAYKANVDSVDVPFGLPVGGTPYMSAQDVSDLVCFLNTLTDNYVPPASPPTSGSCVN
jgi:cytochrome c peroxidase